MAEDLILDQWGNAATGFNTLRKDKRVGSTPTPELLTTTEALSLYDASDTAQIIVDLIADECTREWLDVTIPGEEQTAEEIGAAFDDFKLCEVVNNALKKQRLFGGGAVLMQVNDGQDDLSLPIREDTLQSITSLTVLEPDECVVTAWNGDFTSPDFGQPLYYSIQPKVIGAGGIVASLSRVHTSRVLRFVAPIVSRITMNQKRGWGRSALDNVWPVIRAFDTGFDSASALLSDFAQAVYKLKGLAQALAADKGKLVQSRLEMIDYSRSVMRAIALDADQEDFERKSTPMTGLPETLDRFCNRLSMASRIPVTRLMGQAPAGLNATGDADEKNFQSHVKTQQIHIASPPIQIFTRLLMLSKEGPTGGAEPENWVLCWRPLSQDTEQTKAATRFTMAQADNIYLTAGVLAVDEIRTARFAGDHYSVDTAVEGTDTGDAYALGNAEGTTRIDPATGEPMQAPTGTNPQTTGTSLQATALNGAQVTSALEIVKSFNAGDVQQESAIAMLVNFFQLSEEAATKIVGDKLPAKPQPTNLGAPSGFAKTATPPQLEPVK